MPPREYRTISKQEFLQKYITESWHERLAQYRAEEWKTGNYKNHKKWFNNEGEVMAFIIEYQLPNGTTVVRVLRDGDVFYHVE